MDDAERRRRRDDEGSKPARSGSGSARGGSSRSGRKGGGDRKTGGRPDQRGAGARDRSASRGASASGAPKARSGGAPRGRPPARTGSDRPARKGGSGERRSSGRPDARAGSDKRGHYEQPRTKRAAPGGRGRPGRAAKKRTSRNTDERNPTRSGIDYPTPRYRQRGEPEAAPAPKARPSLRKVQRGRGRESEPVAKETRARKAPARRRPIRATEATEELRQIAGRGATRAVRELGRAADAVSAGHERDAMRILRPLRDQYPDAAAVRELLGLCHYRLGQYPAASKELGAFADLTGSVEQHPVLMDCARAQKKWSRVAVLWEELSAASPSAALVAEGRIVMAGSLADRGRLRDAIALLDRRGNNVQRPAEHHLRVWYVLADLCERAGDHPRARELFDRVRRADPSFADVAERLVALG